MTKVRDTVGAKPIGYELAENVQQGLASTLERAQQHAATDDKTTWTDDALRGAFGAAEFAGDFIHEQQQITKNPFNINDEYGSKSVVGAIAELPGAIGTTAVLGALEGVERALWWGGSNIAKTVGVDPRIGGLTATVVGDLLGPGAIKKTAKAAKFLKAKGIAGVSDEALQMMIRNAPETSLARTMADTGGGPMAAKFISETIDLRQPTIPQRLNYIPDDFDLAKGDWFVERRKLARAEVGSKYNKSKLPPETKGSPAFQPSLKSTGPQLLFDDPRVYNLSSEARKQYNRYETMVKGSPAMQYHHKFTKAVSSPYFQRAEELLLAGKATDADILNLHYIALQRGVGAGDRLSALLYMDKVPHNILHDVMRKAGIEPDASAIPKNLSKKLPDTSHPGQYLSDHSSNVMKIDSITELTEDFIGAIDDIAEPMLREANFLQEAWGKTDLTLRNKLIELRNQRQALGAQLKKGDKTVAKQYSDVETNYKRLKKMLIDQMEIEREKMGFLLDEYGQIIESTTDPYGLIDIKQDRALRQAY